MKVLSTVLKLCSLDAQVLAQPFFFTPDSTSRISVVMPLSLIEWKIPNSYQTLSQMISNMCEEISSREYLVLSALS